MPIKFTETTVNHREVTSLKWSPSSCMQTWTEQGPQARVQVPGFSAVLWAYLSTEKLKWEGNEKILARLLFPRGWSTGSLRPGLRNSPESKDAQFHHEKQKKGTCIGTQTSTGQDILTGTSTFRTLVLIMVNVDTSLCTRGGKAGKGVVI